MELQFLKTLVIIFGASASFVFFLQKLEVPSIEIFARVFRQFQVPRNLIFELIKRIRMGSYEVLREVELPARTLPEKCEVISEIHTDTYLVNDRSNASGRSMKDLRIRTKTGATVIAVKRGSEIIPSPELEFLFMPGDIGYFIRSKETLLKAFALVAS
jgi:CPA2 family monovalent cation:H+ antiporter-2